MFTLPLDVKVLGHAQLLQHLLRKLSSADIVAGEAKHTRSGFLHSSGANLNLCLTNLVFAELYLLTFWRFQKLDGMCQSLTCHTLAAVFFSPEGFGTNRRLCAHLNVAWENLSSWVWPCLNTSWQRSGSCIHLLITHTFFQCPARHQNSWCLCCKSTAVQSSRRDGKLPQKKKEANIYSAGNSNHHK